MSPPAARWGVGVKVGRGVLPRRSGPRGCHEPRGALQGRLRRRCAVARARSFPAPREPRQRYARPTDEGAPRSGPAHGAGAGRGAPRVRKPPSPGARAAAGASSWERPPVAEGEGSRVAGRPPTARPDRAGGRTPAVAHDGRVRRPHRRTGAEEEQLLPRGGPAGEVAPRRPGLAVAQERVGTPPRPRPSARPPPGGRGARHSPWRPGPLPATATACTAGRDTLAGRRDRRSDCRDPAPPLKTLHFIALQCNEMD